jgi:hypothetical protein
MPPAQSGTAAADPKCIPAQTKNTTMLKLVNWKANQTLVRPVST